MHTTPAMERNRGSAQVFEAVSEALRAIYWYVGDLQSFVIHCGFEERYVRSLDWKPKRNGIKRLLDDLAAKRAGGTALMSALIGGIVEQDERFPRLRKLEDGAKRVAEARAAVRALKELLDAHTVVARAEEAREEKRTEAERQKAERQERAKAIETLKQRFMELWALKDLKDEQARGHAFQPWLRALFAFDDLDPRGSFASPGEQLDGSIDLDGRHLLVEARWTADKVDPKGVRDFLGKLDAKLALLRDVGREGSVRAAAVM